MLEKKIFRGKQISFSDPSTPQGPYCRAFFYGNCSNSYYFKQEVFIPEHFPVERSKEPACELIVECLKIYIFKDGMTEVSVPTPHIQFETFSQDPMPNVDLYSFLHVSIMNVLNSVLLLMCASSEIPISSCRYLSSENVLKSTRHDLKGIRTILNTEYEELQCTVEKTCVQKFIDTFKNLLNHHEKNNFFFLSTIFSAATDHSNHDLQSAFQKLWFCTEASIKVVARENGIKDTHVRDLTKFLIEKKQLDAEDWMTLDALATLRNKLFHEYDITEQVTTQNIWNLQFFLSKVFEKRFGAALNFTSQVTMNTFATAKLT